MPSNYSSLTFFLSENAIFLVFFVKKVIERIKIKVSRKKLTCIKTEMSIFPNIIFVKNLTLDSLLILF